VKRRLRRAAIAWACLWLGASALLRALAPPALWEHRLGRALGAPTWSHPWGFDAFGRDLLLIVLSASATSAFFALAAALVSCVLGAAAGTGIAVAPPRARFLALRLLDLTLSFPALLFALAWAALRGPGWDTLLLALLLGTLPPLTRLLAARSGELLAEEFVTAARGLGAGSARIAVRHLGPEVAALCRVKAPNLFAHALLAEATLSFLGIGAPIGRDTWGSLLAQGKDYLLEAPHLAIAAGAPLVLTVVALQFLSETSESS
jgi:peptide/nickel transport system permease protein